MIENRAQQCYDNFIDSFITYNKLFTGCADLNSILSLPYPLFYDVIEHSAKDKRRELKLKKERMDKINQDKATKTLKTRRGSK